MDKITIIGRSPVLRFAAMEFKHYANLMTSMDIAVKSSAVFRTDLRGIIFAVCSDLPDHDNLDIKPSHWDDAYVIQQRGDRLILAGANERSVLFAVYAYFEHLGTRWVRPGKSGEIIPTLPQFPKDELEIRESASYRHRGVCIEGSPSLEHVLGMVDWMAKHRMNSFFLQFQNSGTFWERWYSHRANPRLGKPVRMTDEQYVATDAKVIKELKKRGMLLHQIGHGWTAVTVDLPPNGWQTTEKTVSPRKRRWLAQLDGKRDLYRQIPINTELCYSHAPAFKALVKTITQYASQHPEIDVLHVWLSDAMNNKCECADCRRLTPADWYARLVNVLAESLYAIDPAKRFVFLSYFENWWAPRRTTLESKRGNAILMLAPISRCFRHSLMDPACNHEKTPVRPRLNQVQMPRTNQTFVKLWRDWRKRYAGDTFLFDYYLWSGLHRQATDVKLAQLIHKDMRQLADMGLNGHISCQVIRSFYPTGLPMTAMADTTWNRKVRWSTLKQNFMRAAYGENAEWITTYLDQLEKLLLGKPDHKNGERLESKQPKQLRAIEQFLHGNYMELASRADAANAPTHKQSLQLLLHHNQFLLLKCQAVMGKQEPAYVREWLLRSEVQVHPYLDVPALMSMQL